jgi:hypothetical protein
MLNRVRFGLLIWVANFAFYAAVAQYTGGGADGASVIGFTQFSCSPPANESSFFGGQGSGASVVAAIPGACTPTPSESIFFGGVSDGGHSIGTIQSACTPLANESSFFGGVSDGSHSANQIQGTCLPLANESSFFGGVSDGFHSVTQIQASCAPLANQSTFFGGASDGFSRVSFLTCDPLPIELLEFDLQGTDAGVLVTWATATEINNDFFTLERSRVPVEFEPIAQVKGAGNRIGRTEYRFTDAGPPGGLVYYRIKQTDFDGSFTYSPVKSIVIAGELTLTLVVHPNPTTGREVRFRISGGGESRMAVDFKDQLGRSWYSGVIRYEPERPQDFTLSFGNDLAPGLYILTVRKDGQSVVTKVVVKE